MSFVNYVSLPLRESAATVGTDEQDAAVTLPESVRDFLVVMNKTAEANSDNLLTVRIQAKCGSDWFDLSWDWLQTTAGIGAAADAGFTAVRTPNIIEANSAATITMLAYYASVPSNIIRSISVSSGTTVSHTFSVHAVFGINRF